MRVEDLIKLAGIVLIASGVLVTIGFSVHPHDPTGRNHALWLASHLLILSGFVANLLGMFGLYAVVAADAGVRGLLGFVIAAISLVLYLGKLYWSGFLYPLVLSQHPDFIMEFGFEPGAQPVDPLVKLIFYLGPILFGVGYALLGWAVLKAGALPSVPVLLVVVGALLVGVWPLLPAVVQDLSAGIALIFTVGIAWLGYLLATGRYGRDRRGMPEANGHG